FRGYVLFEKPVTANTSVTLTGNLTQTGNYVITGGIDQTGNELHTGNTTRTGNDTIVGERTTTGLLRQIGDIEVWSDATGGDKGARNTIQGLPKVKLVSLGTATDGTAAGKTLALMDDTPAGEYAATDADVVCTDSTTHVRFGTNALKMAVTAAADTGDGCTDTGLTWDFSSDESVGGWVYSTVDLVAGDLVVTFTDDGGARAINIPVVSAGVWTYIDLTTEITALADADKNSISAIKFGLSAAGAAKAATGAFDVYLDSWYKWDATEEEALGVNLVQDGVLSVVAVATLAASANTPTDLVEGTDFFVHYETGNDFLVWISNQSAASTVAMVAYQ
ncbi:MAG: hypothetical protein AAGU11_08695, partial [Syntrophobacteraceae bacterium]